MTNDELKALLYDDNQAAIDSLTADITSATLTEIEYDDYIDSCNYAITLANQTDKDIYDNAAVKAAAEEAKQEVVDTVSFTESFAGGATVTHDIEVYKTGLDTEELDAVTTALIEAVNTNIVRYTVAYNVNGAKVDLTEDNVNTVATAEFKDGTVTADYGTELTVNSDNDETAWYLSLSSNDTTTRRQKSYQSTGATYQTKVNGNITLDAKVRGENDVKVTIKRRYFDNSGKQVNKNQPTQYVDYTEKNGTYSLEEIYKNTLPNYEFKQYTYQNDAVTSVKVDEEDIVIFADYTATTDAAYTITMESGTASKENAAYNESVNISGAEYGWLEETADGYRPFTIGTNASFFVTEDITLKAVDETTFNSYCPTGYAVNLRQAGAMLDDTAAAKKAFYGQIVYKDRTKVLEYGILLAKPSDVSGSLDAVTADTLKLENVGTMTGVTMVRGKSTKLVGANQFPMTFKQTADRTIKYRGYMIYKDGDETKTIYGEMMTEEASL